MLCDDSAKTLLAMCGFNHPGGLNPRQVRIDGVIYPSINVAAKAIGGTWAGLYRALERGKGRFKGHRIGYIEPRGDA